MSSVTTVLSSSRSKEAILRLLSISCGDIALRQLLAITMQLGLLVLVIQQFQVERTQGLLLITPLIFAGFIVHALLPLRYRMPCFLLLSLTAIGLVFGYKQGPVLVGIGLGLIGICHLPIAFRARIAVLVVTGALLAAVRAEWIVLDAEWLPNRLKLLPTLVLPVLGAMFMFRLILYVYELRHEKKPATIWERLSYFFLLPNVCFLLFPVVDYQTFRRTYYDTDARDIYQKGVLWILRGVLHLLLYRVVYYYALPSPSEVHDLGGLVQSMVTTYLLYLRISGQFHLIVGILCLFGFNLPATHHLYLLASSSNDYWRRINIYWKDFMMKIFYYPAFMQLRRWGVSTAMVVATVTVFFGTWLLHSYQWFWLRGTFPLSGPDALFWAILGGLVVVNSLREARRGRKRSLSQTAWTFRGALVHSLKVVTMFVFICVLWSLWSSPSVVEWMSLVSVAKYSGIEAFVWLLLGLLGLVVIGVWFQYVRSQGWTLSLLGERPSFRRSVLYTSVVTMLLVIVGRPDVRGWLGRENSELIASLQTDRLNKRDQEQREQGYYEGLLNSDQFTDALWNVAKPKSWTSAPAIRNTGDMHLVEHVPLYDGKLFNAPFQVNQWGMRDKEYEIDKPASTFRIALLGSSYTVGGGVDKNFESLVEERLNRDHAGNQFVRYEILNFAVGGYESIQNMIVAERKVFAFNPDAVVYAFHSSDQVRSSSYLHRLVQEQYEIAYPYLQDLMRQSGVEPGMSKSEFERRLKAFDYDVFQWSLQLISAACREQGALPVALFVPLTEETTRVDRAHVDRSLRIAHQAGFVTLSLEGAYGGRDESSLWLERWDTHPNRGGHEMLADRLYEVLIENEHVLNLGLTK